MVDLSYTYELLATLRAEVAAEEAKFMQFRERVRSHAGDPFAADYDAAERAIDKTFRDMQHRLTPVRCEIDQIIKALTDIAALEAPKPFLISSPQA
jgi:Tfp pilus assembly protein PilE